MSTIQGSSMSSRDYQHIAARLIPAGTDQQRMQAVVDALWQALSPTGVSWVGFYLPENDELVLGPRRDTPACSPIGLHGVCGEAYRTRRPVVVRDVRQRGADYVACDPRDRSEVVVPLLAADGSCRGVLDLDSHAVGAFDAADVAGLQQVLRGAGLSV